jgi:SAM-dependent methyltransferase
VSAGSTPVDRFEACPCCGTARTRFSLLTVENGYAVFVCPRCRLALLGPRLHAVEEKEAGGRYAEPCWDDSLAHQRARADVAFASLRPMINERRVRRVVDVGAGFGFFVRRCREHGLDAVGIEPHGPARRYAATVNEARMFEDPGEPWQAGEAAFDLVTLFNVLEHVVDLEQFLAVLRGLMHQESMLVVKVPNTTVYRVVRRLDGLLGRTTSILEGAPDHKYAFTAAALRLLLERNGFTDTRYIGAPPMTFGRDRHPLVARVAASLMPMCDATIRLATANRWAGLFSYIITARKR